MLLRCAAPAAAAPAGESGTSKLLHTGSLPSVCSQRLASRNRESLAELLLAYFQYFAWQFNFGQEVVQIRSPGAVMPKVEKCEACAWSLNDVLR
ncbi:hypothetical protein EON64_15115 [archaeon]|nr:MAG: hypothetical protein EON64_15115 [archaeon]